MPVRTNQRRSPPLEFNVLCFDEGLLRALFISSQCYLICSFPDGRLWESLAAIWCLNANYPRSPSAWMTLLSPSMMPLRLLSCRPVTILCIWLSADSPGHSAQQNTATFGRPCLSKAFWSHTYRKKQSLTTNNEQTCTWAERQAGCPTQHARVQLTPTTHHEATIREVEQ